jgi:exosortase A
LAIGVMAFIVLIAIFRETAWDIVFTWNTSNAFSHGFLILPISLYLGWHQRREAGCVKVEPDYRGLLLLAAGLASWLVGEATGTLLVEELSLVIMVQGLFLTMYGWPLWRTFRFSLLYLFFAVPIGIEIVPKLQLITAAIAVDLIRVIGVPVFNDGTIITIPTGRFLVAEECSGVRFLIASIAIGALFAGITYRSWWRRALFMALSATVPIAANGFRAFGIILLTYLTNNEIASGVDHITYGWIFFTLVTIILFAIGIAFREPPTLAEVSTEHPSHMLEDRQLRPVFVAGFFAIGLCAIGGAYGETLDKYPSAIGSRIVLPVSDGSWETTDSIDDGLPPIFASPDTDISKTYVRDGSAVHLHIGYYANNRRGAQIVTSEHKIGVGPGWVPAAAGSQALNVGGEHLLVPFARSVNSRGGHMIVYWYWIDHQFTGNPYLAKLLEAKVKLLGGDQEAAIVAVGTEYGDNAVKAGNALADFAATLDWLPRVLDQSHAPLAAIRSK